MDFLGNAIPEDMNPFGDDLLPDFLPDMRGFDHLENLPIGNGDIEMENIDGNIEEDLDTPFSLPEMVDCPVREKPKPKDEKSKLFPPAEDAFATIKKLWPDQEEIFKPDKKKRVPKTQKKIKQKFVIGRKSMALISPGKAALLKEPVIKQVRKEDKKIKRKRVSDEGSSDEVDIETIDDESNTNSGSQLLSMKLNGSAARVRVLVPKNRRVTKFLPPIVNVKSPVIKDSILAIKVGQPDIKVEPMTIKVELPEIIIEEPAMKVDSLVAMVNSLHSNDLNHVEKLFPSLEPKVEPVDKVTAVSGLTEQKKEEISPDTLENLKRRENLMRMLPKGARIKPKSKDSVVEKIRQSTQPPRASILIPFPENPFVKTKNGKSSVKNLCPEVSGLPMAMKNLITSMPDPLVKLNSPTITSSTHSPPDSYKVVKSNRVSLPDIALNQNDSKIYEQSILKPVMAKVGNGTSAKTKNFISQPSLVSSSTHEGASSQNVDILIKPIVSALTTTVQRKLMNGDKITLIDELQKLLPVIFPSAKSDHNYCSNIVGTGNDEYKPNSAINTPLTDPWFAVSKNESKPVVDTLGVSAVVTIKSEDKMMPNTSPEKKFKNNLVNKEAGKTISSPWQQDILLDQLRSMKRKCKNSTGSLPSKKHRSSCSPSTSSSSQSNYCLSRSPSHSPRNSGTFTNRSQSEKFGNNNRNYRRRRSRSFSRNSSSRSGSPIYNRKSFSRSRSRSKSPWNRNKSRMRIRSPSYCRSSGSRSRSPSWSRNGDSYIRKSTNNRNKKDFKRGKSPIPVWASNSYKSTREEKNKQIQEKRVIFVGNIPNDTTKKTLYNRFCKFGEILEVSVHFRDSRENFGFVTFAYRCDASDALEHGNDDPKLPRFDLRYGCGRQYKKPRYCDFDLQATADTPKAELDFDSLLQSTQAQLYGKRQC